MEIRYTYIADDGEEFDNEEECLEHEKILDATDVLCMFDEDGELLTSDDPGKNYEESFYLYIIDPDRTEKFLQWIDYSYGYAAPDEVNANDIFYYDENSHQYLDLNERIDELRMKRDKIVNKVKELEKENGNKQN